MKLTVEGIGVITEGIFEGKVSLDGCYWIMTDLSLDPPPAATSQQQGYVNRPATTATTQEEEMRRGPVARGDTCVQVFLEKRKPFDTLWSDVFVESEKDAVVGAGDSERSSSGVP